MIKSIFLTKLTALEWFWLFLIGSFLGVVVEMLWCLLRNHHLESRRGLVWGPFNMLYGFGVILMTVGLWRVLDGSPRLLFLGGVLLGGLYEYFCSVLQEKLVGTVSWDYSDLPFSLHGRINLFYCGFWGILALLWGKVLFPCVTRIIRCIPRRISLPIARGGVVFFVLDAIQTILVLHRANERQAPDGYTQTRFWSWYDRHYPDARVQRIFPNMRFQYTLSNAMEKERHR